MPTAGRCATSPAFVCPVCQAPTFSKVLATRVVTVPGLLTMKRRRRRCEDCGTRYSTIEIPVLGRARRTARARS